MRLRSAGESLDYFADRGRLLANGARELVIVRPYAIRYLVSTSLVEIIDIRHSARKSNNQA